MWNNARKPERDEPVASTAGPRAPPIPLRVSPAVTVLALQRAAGNAATARLLSVESVQRSPETAEAGAAPALERIRQINRSTWVGPFDELELELQWSSIPDLESLLLAPAHWEEFSLSLKAG